MKPNLQFELAHDTIARQVFDKASLEARSRRKVEKFISERFSRQAVLTEDDIDYIKPYLAQVNISEETNTYLQKGQRALWLAKRRRRLITSAVILILSVALGFAFYQNTQVKRQKEIAEKTAFALEYKSFDETQAFKYAQEACVLSNNKDLLAVKTRREILDTKHLLYQNAYTEHQAEISKAIFTLDNQSVISGDYDGLLLKQNASDDSIIYRIVHPDAVEDIRLSHNGRKMAVACRDKYLYLYDIEQGSLIHKFPDHGTAVSQAIFSLDDQFIISSDAKGNLKVWNLSDNSLYKSSDHHGAYINNLKLSPDGKIVMSSGTDGILSLWNWQSESLPRKLQPLESMILTACFHPDGKSYFTVGHNAPITQWDLAQDTAIVSFPNTESKIMSFSISSNSQLLLAGLENGKAQIWSLPNQEMLYSLNGQKKSLNSVSFSRDGKWALSGGAQIHRWNLDQMIPKVVLSQSNGHQSFAPKALYSVRGLKNKFQIWEYTPDSLAKAPLWQSETLENNISTLTVVPHTKFLLSGSEEGEIMIWDLNKKILKKYLQGLEGPISLVRFNPEANRLIAGNEASKFVIWDTQSEAIIDSFQLDSEEGEIISLDISPDGKHILLGDYEGPLWLYSADQDSLSNLLLDNREEINQVFFHSSGERLIVSLGSEIFEMNLQGEILLSYDNPSQNNITSLQYDPEYDYLLGGTIKGDILIWDKQTTYLLQHIGGLKARFRFDPIKGLGIAQTRFFALFSDGRIQRYSSPLLGLEKE